MAEGDDGILAGLAPGKIWVDMTTAAPSVSRELAVKARERGADMVDAPVSGSVSTLEEGRLSIMVGGRPETFAQVEPILQDIGPKVTLVGDNGQALLLKIAINLSLHVQMVAFSEGLLLAEKDGIDREVAVDVMLSSVIASPMLKYRGPFVLEQPEEAWFNVQHDAEGHAPRARGGPGARRADADDGGLERAADGGARHGPRHTTTSPSSSRCSREWPAFRRGSAS